MADSADMISMKGKDGSARSVDLAESAVGRADAGKPLASDGMLAAERPVDPRVAATFMSGMLIKYCDGSPPGRKWQKRYFELKMGNLSYTNKAGQRKKVELDMTNSTALSAVDKAKNCIQILAHKKTLFLCAETEGDWEDWMAALRAVHRPPTPEGGASVEEGDAMAMYDDGTDEEAWRGRKPELDDFDLLKVLGKGNFGKVMMVRHKHTGEIFALKSLRKEAVISRAQTENTKNERHVLEHANHPFMVRLRYAFQTPDKLFLVMDFAQGGELFFHLKKERRFKEDRARFYAAQVVDALAHLHTHDIIYRDLKPENVLLQEDGYIAITDFGLAKTNVLDEKASTFCGTPEYLAPEILKLREGDTYGLIVDWWTLGCLLYEMLQGIPPFYSTNINTMYEKILRGELRLPQTISSEGRDILSRLLTRDPAKRLGSNGAQEIRDHPWFRQVRWEDLVAKKVKVQKDWIPKIVGVNCFDLMFTSEEPIDSVVESSALGDTEVNFEGFTFVEEGVMGGASAGDDLGENL